MTDNVNGHSTRYVTHATKGYESAADEQRGAAFLGAPDDVRERLLGIEGLVNALSDELIGDLEGDDAEGQ